MELQEHCRNGPTKEGLDILRERVEDIQDDKAIADAGGLPITLHDGTQVSEVTQKELLRDMIDNQLLIIDGEPPYCVLCNRRKVKSMSIVCAYCGWMSNSCIHCQSGSDKKICQKCGQPQSDSFSVSDSSGKCHCAYTCTQSFVYCKGKDCKQPLREYEANDPTCLNSKCVSTAGLTESFLCCAKCRQLKQESDSRCANCDCKVTVFIERCSKCKWMKKLLTIEASDSESCVHCDCLKTKSFKCCTICTHMKASTVNSHAIPNCTLRALQKESDWRRRGPVIYSYKHRTAKQPSDVTWYILCSHCEHANHLNVAENVTEQIRRYLDEYHKYDIEIDIEDARLLLIAAAFDIYRGFMVNVDLFKKLRSPGLAHPLLQTFYSLKRYCKNPDIARIHRPDIYLFLLPSYDVSEDFDREDQTLLLHDPYMRMIQFTHVVTPMHYQLECSFLCSSFDRVHFILPLPRCKEELIPHMLSRYPKSELFCPNLSQHQSTVLMLRNGESAVSFFPQLLYEIGYLAAKKFEEMYRRDRRIKRLFRIAFRPNFGIINIIIYDEDSKEPARMPQKKQNSKAVKFVRQGMHVAVPDVGAQSDTQPVQASS